MKYIILIIFIFSIYKTIQYLILDDDQDGLVFWWCVGLITGIIEMVLLS